MKIRLDYGRDGLEIELPEQNVKAVLGLQALEALPDPIQAVRDAIANPIGTKPFSELIVGKTSACIVVCDVTRPVPNPQVLTPILEQLKAAEIPCTILIATGTHRPNTPEELLKMLGQTAVDQCKIENHDCIAYDTLRLMGESPNGVPIWLNKTYLDADLKITLGMIEPHFMAGYAGGRKMVMPGIAGLESTKAWHSPKFLEHTLATMGEVKGNPVHEEAEWIALQAKPDFIVDVALDTKKQMAAVFAGDMVEAWSTGVAFVAERTKAFIDEPVDVVITTCGGYPLDLTYYQTVKGMVGALPIVKPGGTIIIASACDEGIGNHHFAESLKLVGDIHTIAARMESGKWEFVADQWQIEELAKAARNANISLICRGIPMDSPSPLFANRFNTIEEAVAEALSQYGEDASIVVIPKGPYVIPAIKK